jgi:hypothetical protein
MKTLYLLLNLIFSLVLLPFTLLDYFVFKYPKERRAKKWRKRMAIGDQAYFYNMLGRTTEFKIENINKEKRLALCVNRSRSGWEDFDSLYPVES